MDISDEYVSNSVAQESKRHLFCSNFKKIQGKALIGVMLIPWINHRSWSHKQHDYGTLHQVLIAGVREPRIIMKRRAERCRMDKNKSKPFLNEIDSNSYQNPSICPQLF